MCRILENPQKTFFYWKKIQLQVSKWGYFGEKKSKSLWVVGTFFMKKGFSDFLDFFLEIRFRGKKCAVFWKIFQKLFLAEINPTLSFKKVGILVQIPYGKSTLFDTTGEAKCPDTPRSGVAKLFYLNR